MVRRKKAKGEATPSASQAGDDDAASDFATPEQSNKKRTSFPPTSAGLIPNLSSPSVASMGEPTRSEASFHEHMTFGSGGGTAYVTSFQLQAENEQLRALNAALRTRLQARGCAHPCARLDELGPRVCSLVSVL